MGRFVVIFPVLALLALVGFAVIGPGMAGAQDDSQLTAPPITAVIPVATPGAAPSCEYLLDLVYDWGVYYERTRNTPVGGAGIPADVVSAIQANATATVTTALANTNQSIAAYQHYCLPG